MPLNAAVSNIMKQMEQEGAMQLTTEMQSWMGQIRQVISAINSYQATTNSILKQSAQVAVKNMQDSGAYNSRIYTNVDDSKRQIKYQHFVQQGYILLNQIGEFIRGKEIKYKLIIRTDNDSTIYEWSDVSLKDFLKLSTIADSGRMRLRSENTVMEALSKKYGKKESVRWGEEKVQSYEKFREYITNYIDDSGKQRWAEVNQGNIMEAFVKYYDNKQKGTMESYMYSTMSGNQAFWRGGDYDDYQVKSNEASITNISSIITQLESTYSKLASIQTMITANSNSNSQAAAGVTTNIETSIKKQVEQKVQELVKEFTTTQLTI